jgi:hypothetical protein
MYVEFARDKAKLLLRRHSPDSRGFGARIVPLTGLGNADISTAGCSANAASTSTAQTLNPLAFITAT